MALMPDSVNGKKGINIKVLNIAYVYTYVLLCYYILFLFTIIVETNKRAVIKS